MHRLTILLTAVLVGSASAQDSVNPGDFVAYPEVPTLGATLDEARTALARGDLDGALDRLDGLLATEVADLTSGSHVAAVGSANPRLLVGVTDLVHAALRELSPEMVARWRARFDASAAADFEEAAAAPDPGLARARAFERWPLATGAARLLSTLRDEALARDQPGRARWALERLVVWCPEEAAPEAAGTLERLRRSDPAQPVRGLPRGDPENRGRSDGPVRVQPAARPVRWEAASPRWTDEGGGLPLVHGAWLLLITQEGPRAWNLATGAAGPAIPRPGQIGVRGDRLRDGAISGDLLVAPFPVQATRSIEGTRGALLLPDPLYRLGAFDLAAWRWRWIQRDPLPGRAGWSLPVRPAIQDGVVLAPAVSGAARTSARGILVTESWVLAFDLATGAPRWSQRLARGPVEGGGAGSDVPAVRLCSPPALDRATGTLVHCTSQGAVAALDAFTGRPRWLAEYEPLVVRPLRGYYAELRELGWRTTAPVVDDGVVIVAPLDAARCLALDLATGARLWSLPRRAARDGSGLSRLHGVGRTAAGEPLVVLSGDDLVAVELHTGRLRWRTPLGERPGAGLGWLAGPTLLLPRANPPRLATYDLATGALQGEVDLRVGGVTHVALAGDQLVAASDGAFELLPVSRE